VALSTEVYNNTILAVGLNQGRPQCVTSQTGGTATRLSSPRGEELFPRFSPDGVLIAYSANYDGNQDIYVSLERRMKCGVAQCGHCQIGAKYVCKDGPVFTYARVRKLPKIWD
jgi:hypothetical protein